jgi:hypothetical protein
MTETDQNGLIRFVTPLTGTGLSRIRTGPSLVPGIRGKHQCHELSRMPRISYRELRAISPPAFGGRRVEYNQEYIL